MGIWQSGFGAEDVCQIITKSAPNLGKIGITTMNQNKQTNNTAATPCN